MIYDSDTHQMEITGLDLRTYQGKDFHIAFRINTVIGAWGQIEAIYGNNPLF